MATLEELERRLARLENVEAIQQLKYRYWRWLDAKDWDALATCFTVDAVACYGDGKYRFDGRAAILAFLREALGPERGSVGVHHGHQPEIELVDDSHARGRFTLDNYMFNEGQDRCLRIAALYEDDFVRVDGEWKIARIGYRTLLHEEWKRSDTPSLRRIV